MMKKIVKMSVVSVALFFMVSTMQAQKFGYLNSASILSELPEVKQMRSNLEGLQAQLEKKGKQMVTEYQAKEKDATTKKSRGELSPLEEEKVMKELQDKQNEIVKYQSDSQKKLSDKEQELLKPILEKVNTAINEVAKENGLQFVFDSSTGVILYADETQDVSEMVKTKLGNL